MQKYNKIPKSDHPDTGYSHFQKKTHTFYFERIHIIAILFKIVFLPLQNKISNL